MLWKFCVAKVFFSRERANVAKFYVSRHQKFLYGTTLPFAFTILYSAHRFSLASLSLSILHDRENFRNAGPPPALIGMDGE
jgi:hypothetical protein